MTSKRRRLNTDEIKAALKTLPGWSVSKKKLHRDYAFGDFVRAWGFMSAAALVIQQMDHHPEWCNVYDRLAIDLVTHDLKGISTWDVELARKLEALATPWQKAR
ncbi:MAG: 4a-hydroxytetrahydrobiopterin dehydratase [Candidatus Eisenbacteria bacterium]